MNRERRRVGRVIRKRRRLRALWRERILRASGFEPYDWQIDMLVAIEEGGRFVYQGGRRGGRMVVVKAYEEARGRG